MNGYCYRPYFTEGETEAWRSTPPPPPAIACPRPHGQSTAAERGLPVAVTGDASGAGGLRGSRPGRPHASSEPPVASNRRLPIQRIPRAEAWPRGSRTGLSPQTVGGQPCGQVAVLVPPPPHCQQNTGLMSSCPSVFGHYIMPLAQPSPTSLPAPGTWEGSSHGRSGAQAPQYHNCSSPHPGYITDISHFSQAPYPSLTGRQHPSPQASLLLCLALGSSAPAAKGVMSQQVSG